MVNTDIVYCVQWSTEQIYVVCELRWMHTSSSAPAMSPRSSSACWSVNGVKVKCNIQVVPGASGVKKISIRRYVCGG